MKVLFITNAVDGTGGYARLKVMGRALVKAGHTVFWLAPGIKDLSTSFSLLKYDLGKRSNIRNALRKAQRQIVDLALCISATELNAWKLLQCKELRSAHKMFFQRHVTIPNFSFHADFLSQGFKRLLWRIKIYLYTYLIRYVARRMDTLIFQAPWLRDDCLANTGPVKAKIEILPNDCNLDWNGRAVEKVDIPWSLDGPPVIMVMSNLHYLSKGIDSVLDAFDLVSKQREIRLVLVGKVPPEDKRCLLSRIQNSPQAKNILNLGFIPNAVNLLPYAAVFCAPSRIDACPNSVLEAMAAKIPVLASDIPAHRFLLEDKRLLFSPDEPLELASSLASLLSDEDTRKENVEIVKRQANKFSFDWEARFVDICEKAVNRDRRS